MAASIPQNPSYQPPGGTQQGAADYAQPPPSSYQNPSQQQQYPPQQYQYPPAQYPPQSYPPPPQQQQLQHYPTPQPQFSHTQPDPAIFSSSNPSSRAASSDRSAGEHTHHHHHHHHEHHHHSDFDDSHHQHTRTSNSNSNSTSNSPSRIGKSGWAAKDIKDRNVLLGAGSGAAVGSILVPGVGTAAGAVIGAVAGKKHEKHRRGREEEFGTGGRY